MSKVGEQLRAAREARGLDIHQVAETTKIKTEHIRALEAGDFDAFPAAVYVRGFTRTYATLLKLDAPSLLDATDAEMAAAGKFRDDGSFEPRRRDLLGFATLQLTRLDWQLVVPVVAVLVLVGGGLWGYTAWRRHKTADPLTGLGPGLYQPKQTNRGEYLPLPTNAPSKSSKDKAQGSKQ
jgi:cytoskeletal protein RodZ